MDNKTRPKVDLSKRGDLFTWLQDNKPLKSYLYPARINPAQLLDSIDALVTSTVKTGDEDSDHWIWEGKTNERGVPVRFKKPVAWFFFEITQGFWHEQGGLVRTCDEPLCVRSEHYEVRMP